MSTGVTMLSFRRGRGVRRHRRKESIVTPVDITFFYGTPPTEAEVRALHEVREVYAIRRVETDDRLHAIRVEYDASRLTENDIAALLRNAGINLCRPVRGLIPL